MEGFLCNEKKEKRDKEKETPGLVVAERNKTKKK
jgi:hypothetical protein